MNGLYHNEKVQAIGSHFAWRLEHMQKWPENGPLSTSHSNEPIKVLSIVCAWCTFLSKKGRKTKAKIVVFKSSSLFRNTLPILGLSLFTAMEFGSGSARNDFFTNGNLDLLYYEEMKTLLVIQQQRRRFIYEIVTLAYRISLIRSFFPPSDTGHSQSISTPSKSPLR